MFVLAPPSFAEATKISVEDLHEVTGQQKMEWNLTAGQIATAPTEKS